MGGFSEEHVQRLPWRLHARHHTAFVLYLPEFLREWDIASPRKSQAYALVDHGHCGYSCVLWRAQRMHSDGFFWSGAQRECINEPNLESDFIDC